MIETIALLMAEYEKGNKKRINHFMKVFAYSQMIGKSEHLDERTQMILEITALMHDIGILKSLEKYGSSAGPYQEKEGPSIARKMLSSLSVDKDMIERICYLIGHHHTYDDIEGLDYQILVEADFLVNLDENQCSMEAIEHARNHIFKTQTGLKYLEDLFKKE